MNHPKRSITTLAALTAMAGSVTPTLRAADPPDHPLLGTEINSDQQRSVENGLAALAKRQDREGNFGQASGRRAGITSLCAMAFMQSGNLPGRGRYGPQVERALTFVLNSAQESGLIATDNSTGPMYGHGFATLFLAEVYGMTGDERVKEKLQKAIKLIQKSQNNEGGWRYQPAPVDADISVTICQVMALRAARDAGIKVEKEVIDRALEYVRRCQNSDGGFSYQVNQAGFGGGSGFGRTAAGLSSYYYAGISDGKDVDRALAYLAKFKPGAPGGRGDAEGNYFYGQYYAVQAMFLAGGEYWAGWYPAVRKQLIERQNKTTGLWSGDQPGEDYATAMALLVLQMPNRYLPVYAGKGPGS